MAMRKIPDPWVMIMAAGILIVGLLMVGSASRYVSLRYWGTPMMLFMKQLGHFALGSALLYMIMKRPYEKLADRRLLLWLFAACVAMLIAVFFFPAAGGGHRWIVLGPVRFQPSELTKLFVILFTAKLLAEKGDDINDLRRVALPGLAVVSLLAALIVAEPDLGSAVILVAVPVGMAFAAGLHLKYLGGLAMLGGLAGGVAIIMEPYRWERLKDFLLTLFGLQEPSYQIWQARIAFGSGGLIGEGLGQGLQKAYFVPAAHTDFIYAILGEELGLAGTIGILAAFMIIAWRGLRTARCTADPFGSYLALGCTLLLVIQAMTHVCVCLGLLPTTGLPMPLVSYGGSSLVVSMAAIGLLLKVSLECNFRPSLRFRRLKKRDVYQTGVSGTV